MSDSDLELCLSGPDAERLAADLSDFLATELGERPRLVCLNKVDLVDEEWVALCQEDLAEVGCTDVIPLSALQGDGTNALRKAIVGVLSPYYAAGF